MTTSKFEFSSEGLSKRVFEPSGDEPLEKYRRVLDENINITSINRGFRINNNAVETYEQIKKKLS